MSEVSLSVIGYRLSGIGHRVSGIGYRTSAYAYIPLILVTVATRLMATM